MRLTFPQILYRINHELAPDIPEKQLICAIVSRGIADYIYYLMLKNHGRRSAYHYNDIRDVPKWIRQIRDPFSACDCCKMIGIPWDYLRQYLDKIESNSDNLVFLEKELLKYN